MNQAKLFQEENPLPEFEHGGYSPASPRWYRGREIPATYLEHQGMRTFQLPTLQWVMDEVLEALRGGPILSREMHLYVASTLGRPWFRSTCICWWSLGLCVWITGLTRFGIVGAVIRLSLSWWRSHDRGNDSAADHPGRPGPGLLRHGAGSF